MSPGLITLVALASIVAYGFVAFGTRSRARRARPPNVAEDSGVANWSANLIWIPYLVLALRPGPEVDIAEPLRWVGLVLVVAGPAVMIWSAITLGRHFDVEVIVHGEHEVVRTGPYALVRHPIYAALAVHFLGACLASGNAILTVGTLLVGVPGLYLRASAEETLLRRTLGEAYERYAREVPMLIPFMR